MACFLSFGQADVKLQPPLEIPLALSGNFAELRGGHFHAGLDLKTKGRQGLQVKAVASGSVRRIRVSTSGYGKTLYIEHPNGLTSVYAHLQKFAPKIEQLVKSIQYEKEQFEIQKFLRKGELTVESEELIGYSGNTGGSFGPHLHFEIRDSDSQRPINPLRMGFDVADSQRPQLRQLYLFDAQERNFQSVSLQKINDSVYQTDLLFTKGKIGLGLSMFDRQDLSYNRNGIYSAEVYLNGRKVFYYTFDQIDFKDAEYIPLFIDYPLSKTQKRKLYKLFRPQFSKLSFLKNSQSNGMLSIEEGKSYQVKVVLSDFNGNRSYLESYIDGQERERVLPTYAVENGTHTITTDKDFLVALDTAEVYFPKETFFNTQDVICSGGSSHTLQLDLPIVPVRNALKVSFTPPPLDSLQFAQSSIVREDEKGTIRFLPTQKKDSRWTTTVKEGGLFSIMKDSIAPSIKPLNFKNNQWVSRYRYLKVRIDDQESGIKAYRATINGKWVRFEYEPKSKLLTYDFRDQSFEEAAHELKIEVTDGVGNKSILETTLFRRYGLD